MPDLKDFGGLGGLGGAAGGLGALASLAGGGGHSAGGGLGGLGGMGIGMLAGMAGGAAMGGGRNRNRNHYNNHRNDAVNMRNHYNNHRNNCGGGGYHSGHGGHGGFGGGGGFGHHGFGGGYGPGGFGVGLGGMGMGMGMGGGYGMGGMGGHHGYRGGHHGYRGSSMRLPWMGVLAATAVAGGAAAVYPRGARSQVTWKEGSKQVSAQVGGLTVNVARAQNLKSVSTMSTQDPYVKAKLLVDGFQISEVRSGTHNNGGRNPDWTRKNNFFTFYVPSNVPLSNLAVVLEVYDSNSVSSDKLIGTCGKIPLNGIADGKMRWWTVTSGGQLQASVYSDVQFGRGKPLKTGGQYQQQYQQKPKKNKDKSKKKKKNKDKHRYGGGGGNQGNLRNEYNHYVNGMNTAGRNQEVVPFEVWANGRYRDRSSSSSSSSSGSSSSGSDSDYDRKHGGRRKHGYGDQGGYTGYTAPAGGGYAAPAATAPPGSYAAGAAGTPAAAFQSPNYRPPATAPSAPPAYPATAYPPAAGVQGQPQPPPPYPGEPQQGYYKR